MPFTLRGRSSRPARTSLGFEGDDYAKVAPQDTPTPRSSPASTCSEHPRGTIVGRTRLDQVVDASGSKNDYLTKDLSTYLRDRLLLHMISKTVLGCSPIGWAEKSLAMKMTTSGHWNHE